MRIPQRHRRGSIYLMVMVTVVIVVVLGLTALILVRVQRRVAGETLNLTDARAGAFSAVEHGVAMMDPSAAWRAEAAANGGSMGTFALGRGTMTATVSDPSDGNLTNSDSDPVDLVCTGMIADAVQMYSVRLSPRHVPMSCLKAGIAAASNITLSNTSILGFGGEGLVTNGGISASSSRVYLPVKAAGAVAGSTYYAGSSGGQPARQFPNPTLLVQYVSMGSQITSSGMSGRTIENVLITPSSNPYGSANARGVYWLDCDGDDYIIQNCRIVGTLVLIRCTGTLTIKGSVVWEPASAGMPALLVHGGARFSTSMSPLKESSIDRNLNPASCPYEGASDSDKTDIYPSRIKGLVYVSGDAEFLGETMIDGAFVGGGKLTGAGSLSVLYDDSLYYTPPMGFRASTVMSVVPGTFVQVVN